jgi:hypothetical protein
MARARDNALGTTRSTFLKEAIPLSLFSCFSR